jgi:hypothetical protein
MSLGGSLGCPLGCPGRASLKNRARYLFGANSLICERCGKESGVDSWRVDAGLDYIVMRERIEEFLRSRPGAYCANCVGRELPAIPRFVHDAIGGMRSRKFVVGDVVCAGCGERKTDNQDQRGCVGLKAMPAPCSISAPLRERSAHTGNLSRVSRLWSEVAISFDEAAESGCCFVAAACGYRLIADRKSRLGETGRTYGRRCCASTAAWWRPTGRCRGPSWRAGRPADHHGDHRAWRGLSGGTAIGFYPDSPAFADCWALDRRHGRNDTLAKDRRLEAHLRRTLGGYDGCQPSISWVD